MSRHGLVRRLALAWTAQALAVVLLFALLALALLYEVEDRLLARPLAQEAALREAHRARHGDWGTPGAPGIALHDSLDSLPPDLRRTLAAEPARREAVGDGGRHYQLHPLGGEAGPPWLVAEVGARLVVRTMRPELLAVLGLGFGAALVLSVALAWALARHIGRPIEALAARIGAAPGDGADPGLAALAARDDEVGALAGALVALQARLAGQLAREQAFTRDASHELRTPLAVLRGGLDALAQQPDLPPAQRDALAPLQAAARLMAQAVDALLLLAREPQTGAAPPPVPVLPLLEDWVLAHAEALDAQGLTVRLDLQPGDALALPAPVLQTVLAGLLGNALVHARHGGSIRVEREADGALRLCNPVAPPGQPRPWSGLGLGLAIVGRLLERHGGALDWRRDDQEACARVRGP
jgi:signal transduction histidine kinase